MRGIFSLKMPVVGVNAAHRGNEDPFGRLVIMGQTKDFYFLETNLSFHESSFIRQASQALLER